MCRNISRGIRLKRLSSKRAVSRRLTDEGHSVQAKSTAVYSSPPVTQISGVYTITEEKNGYGKLKSGAGWVKLADVKILGCILNEADSGGGSYNKYRRYRYYRNYRYYRYYQNDYYYQAAPKEEKK